MDMKFYAATGVGERDSGADAKVVVGVVEPLPRESLLRESPKRSGVGACSFWTKRGVAEAVDKNSSTLETDCVRGRPSMPRASGPV
jgi:hypothetical protein